MRHRLLVALIFLAASSMARASEPPLPTGDQILERSRQGLRFAAECADGPGVSIAAVGDVLLHDGRQEQAVRDPSRFVSLWSSVREQLERADVTHANLEGTTSWGIDRDLRRVPDPGFVFDDNVYSGLPRVNYHASLLDDLVASGVDVVSTANNHAMDRGPLGQDRTIEALKSAGLRFTGTRRRLVDDRVADAVIVTPHWGRQFEHVPERRARNGGDVLARQLRERA